MAAGDTPLVRVHQVGMSVEALASSWARREHAPDGAVIVLDSEVAGRVRGGAPWALGGDDALMLAVVTRPAVDPMQEALLWLPASLAAADCLEAASGLPQRVLWPDRVIAHEHAEPWAAVNVTVQLGPGRVEHAIFSLRVDTRPLRPTVVDTDLVIETLVAGSRRYLDLLHKDPRQLLHDYAERCAQMSERVRADLLPRGEARGRMAGIDADGFLVLESPTGMLERVAPASLKAITVVP